MANTFELIASYTVGSGGQASIDFTSIPATYTDLVLRISSRSNSTSGNWNDVIMNINGQGAATNISARSLVGTGSGTGSGTGGASSAWAYSPTANNTANTFGNTDIYIPNYAGSSAKSASSDSVGENNATATLAALTAGLWNQTAAITSISISGASSNFVQYSTAYLYGVKNA